MNLTHSIEFSVKLIFWISPLETDFSEVLHILLHQRLNILDFSETLMNSNFPTNFNKFSHKV